MSCLSFSYNNLHLLYVVHVENWSFNPGEQFQAMSTLYRTAYHVDMKTTPAWYEQKRPRTRTSRSHSPTDRTGAVGRRGFGAENTIYARTAVYFRAFS